MPLKSVNFLIITSLYACNLSNLELIFQLTDTYTPNWGSSGTMCWRIYKVVFSTELVVTFMYTGEGYAGNQNK